MSKDQAFSMTVGKQAFDQRSEAGESLENRSKRLGIDISELRPEKESEVTYNNETKEPIKKEQEISEYEEKLDNKDTKLKEVGLPFAEREY